MCWLKWQFRQLRGWYNLASCNTADDNCAKEFKDKVVDSNMQASLSSSIVFRSQNNMICFRLIMMAMRDWWSLGPHNGNNTHIDSAALITVSALWITVAPHKKATITKPALPKSPPSITISAYHVFTIFAIVTQRIYKPPKACMLKVNNMMMKSCDDSRITTRDSKIWFLHFILALYIQHRYSWW